MSKMIHSRPPSIVLFDGVCNLCDHSVQFIIRHDTHRQFRFAALQSAAGQRLLEHHHASLHELNSVVLVENGRIYYKSSAVLRIARRLGGVWALTYIFVLLPRSLRDVIYKTIAEHRYQWFGQRDSCMMPTPDLKSRFLA